MKKKDYLIVALAPTPVLLIALIGNLTVKGWVWKWNDFLFAWVVLASAALVYKLMATSKAANLTYKLGAALAVLAGFLVTWVSAAVKIIGEENPANLLYLVVIVIGLAGMGLSRFQARGLARAAFTTAAAIFVVPVIALLAWPSADFSPGVPQVFALNSGFALMFAVSGLLFRHAAGQAARTGATAAAA